MERLRAATEFTAEDLAAHLGIPPFRGRQILRWVDRGATTFAEMTDLPAPLREELSRRLCVLSSEVAEVSESPDGTRKILVRMEDGELVECVLIPAETRLTLCMSSQVGCPAKCAFCASGMLGLTRSLSRHEIVEQYLHASRLAGGGDRITNLVLMGMGEPLLNYDEVVAAVRRLPLGKRRITISTVGLVERIRRLKDEGLPVNLAVSLHAPTNEIRDRLVPVNRKYGVDEVIRAAREYFDATGRDVTFEYILIDGENSEPQHADALAALLRGGNLNVNLIPMNPVESLPWRPPAARKVEEFRRRLEAAGIPTHVRQPRGREIDAACGQLRLRRLRAAKTGGAAAKPPRP